MKHELDKQGEQVHRDVDPYIPTGVCAICTKITPETEAPEDRTP